MTSCLAAPVGEGPVHIAPICPPLPSHVAALEGLAASLVRLGCRATLVQGHTIGDSMRSDRARHCRTKFSSVLP